LIEKEVDDELIAQKYKSLIVDFFDNMKKKNVQQLLKDAKNSKLFIKYISQNKEFKNVRTRNVKIQIAKVLHEKF
jgi:predicted ATP-dependent protease